MGHSGIHLIAFLTGLIRSHTWWRPVKLAPAGRESDAGAGFKRVTGVPLRCFRV